MHGLHREAGRGAGLLIILGTSLAALSGCAGSSEPCPNFSGQPVTVFLEDTMGPYSMSFVARVQSISDSGSTSFTKVGLADNTGTIRSLKFRAEDTPLPLQVNTEYSFQVDYAPGSPSLSALVVQDNQGLLFAAASELSLGKEVLRTGIPGFTLAQRNIDCPVTQTTCFDSYQEMALRFSDGENHRLLKPGESTRLGSFVITCIVSRKVTYTSACADAAVVNVSYVIQRLAGSLRAGYTYTWNDTTTSNSHLPGTSMRSLSGL